MKKTGFFLTVAAVVTAVTTSCTSGENEVVNNDERVAVQFASGVADVSSRVDDTTWDGDEHIGIFMVGNGQALSSANILEDADNVQYQTASTGLTTASFASSPGVPAIFYPVTGSVNFIAYYPYNTVATGGTFSLPVNVANQLPQSAIDVLYAHAITPYDKNTTGAVTLPFEHKLVKLKFNISNDASVTAPLNNLEVKISGQNTQATLNLVSGDVTPTVAPTTITALTPSNGLTSEAIVLPLADNTGVTLSFRNTAGEEFTSAVPQVSGSSAWESGKSYTYTVVLKKNGINIEGSIAAWINAGTGTTDAE